MDGRAGREGGQGAEWGVASDGRAVRRGGCPGGRPRCGGSCCDKR